MPEESILYKLYSSVGEAYEHPEPHRLEVENKSGLSQEGSENPFLSAEKQAAAVEK